MSNGAPPESEAEVIVGLAILGLLVMVGAYLHDAAAECLRYNVGALNSDRFLDLYPRTYRVIVGLIAALALYAILRGLNRLFHLFGKPWLETLVIVIGVVLAGLIPPDLFGTLCRAP